MFPEQEEKLLSKRQQKKALKSLTFAKFKEERNLKRKERKRAKKLEGSTRTKLSLPIKNAVSSGHIIIDCSYETLMNEKVHSFINLIGSTKSLCTDWQVLCNEQACRLAF